MKTDAKINNFIDGQFVEPIGGKYLGNIEPATGKPYSHPQVADSDAPDVDLRHPDLDWQLDYWQRCVARFGRWRYRNSPNQLIVPCCQPLA